MKMWNGLKNKITKENMLVVALFGILLLVIGIPVEKEERSEKEEVEETVEIENGQTESYEEKTEEKLQNLLRKIEGVGQVSVMITWVTSEEMVVEKDIPSEMDNMKEKDSTGGSRETISSAQQENTVYDTDQDGKKTPYVVMHRLPKVGGVMVVAEGGGNAAVQKNITEVIMALFGIEAHKIKVVKMK